MSGKKLLQLLLFTLIVAFGTLGAMAPAGSAYYMTFYTNTTLTPGENATVVGEFHNSSNSSYGEALVMLNVTVSFPGGNATNGGMTTVVVNNTNSTFTVRNVSTNFTSAAGVSYYILPSGDQTLSITTNSTAAKFATIRITNVSSATVTFVENLPPFFLGSKIVAKVIATNSSSRPVVNQTVAAKIYAADGAQPSWGSNTSSTDDSGIAYINFTIPSTASSGTYILSVENGAAVSVFVIKEYTVTLKTKDASGADKSKFSPGEQVTVETGVTSNGNPTSADSVSCSFIDANNLVTAVTGTNTGNGTYQCNFTTSSTAQTYNVKVTTTKSSKTQTTYATFATQSFSVSLAPRSGMGFFKEFGGKKAFTIGQPIQMDIIVTNVSTGELLAEGTGYNCTPGPRNITIVDVWFAQNGTSINSSVEAGNTSLKTGMYMMTNGCYYNFSVGQRTGVFGIRVNVSGPGGSVVSGQGYFSINKYILKIEPASLFGGMDFNALLKPGENASFKISAYNLTNGTEINVADITTANVTKITPLSFTGTISEVSAENVIYTFVNDPTKKYFTVHVPASTGPQLLSAWATVAGENVTGEAFYMGKYVIGFAAPSGNMFMGGEQEGEGGGPPSGGAIACTVGKKVEFTGMTMDASTQQPVKGVNFLNIREARNEMTGQSVTQCFSATKAISGTTGQATFNFTFQAGTGCSDLSGSYFVIFNVSWKDKTDFIPSFFECRQLNVDPTVEPWDAQPTSTIQINVSNATYANGSNIVVISGNISLVSLMNYNPNTGGQVLTPKSDRYLNGSIALATAAGGSKYYVGNLSISPADFVSGGKNLTSWPNGFYDGRVKVCDSGDNVCDTATFGFGILPFRAYTTWWMGGAVDRTYAAGDVVNTSLYVQTVISTNATSVGNWTNMTQNYTDNPGFDIKIMSPESQTEYAITTFNFSNVTNDTDMCPTEGCQYGMAGQGWQKWNVSFQLPAALPKGWYEGLMTINNTNGSTVEMFVDFNVRSYEVGIPHKEKLQAGSTTPCNWVKAFNCSINATSDAKWAQECQQYGFNPPSQLYDYGKWNDTDSLGKSNWTYIVETFGIDPNRDGDACVYKNFTLTAEDSQSGASASPNAEYSVLAFGNATTKMMFFKNSTGAISKINEMQNIPGTKQYLMKIEGPWYSIFINATNTTPRSSGGLVQTTWGWAGQFQVNQNFTVPFIVTRSNAAMAGLNVTIENMVKMESAGFGVLGMANLTSYSTTVNGTCGAISDANGVAWVPLNVSEVGKFKPFWKLNNSASDTGSFDRSPTIDVIAFYTYGQFVTLYPQGGNNVTLRARDGNTEYLGGSNGLGNYYPANASMYFNGTFVEQNGSEFIADGKLDTWYFMLANATTNYNVLYVDNDTTYGQDGGEGQNDKWATTDQMLSTDKISIQVGQNQYTLAEKSNSSSANTSTLVFYTETSGTEQLLVSSATQKVPVRLCAQNLQYKGINATINLQYVNWMTTLGPPVPQAMTVYNVTTGASTTNVNISSLKGGGCIIVKVLPSTGSWENGVTEITGSVQQLSISTPSEPIGTAQQIWAGQVKYVAGGLS